MEYHRRRCSPLSSESCWRTNLLPTYLNGLVFDCVPFEAKRVEGILACREDIRGRHESVSSLCLKDAGKACELISMIGLSRGDNLAIEKTELAEVRRNPDQDRVKNRQSVDVLTDTFVL